jgi:5-methylcytosine-specific restriction endonuclease McrA
VSVQQNACGKKRSETIQTIVFSLHRANTLLEKHPCYVLYGIKLEDDMEISKTLKGLSDQTLLTQLEVLSVTENEATVDILLHLAEVEKRELYAREGYSSLFAYCTQSKLRYSEPAAGRRISCARVVTRFPELIELLLQRELNLSTLSLVSGILSAENKTKVISSICGKSRREVEEFVSGFCPRREVKERIKPVVIAKQAKAQPAKCSCGSLFEQAPDKQSANHCAIAGERTAKESQEQVLKPQVVKEQRYELRFSISSALMEKLDEAKCVLSGKYPQGVLLEAVLEEALEVLLDKRSPERREKRRAKRKLGKVKKTVAKPAKQSRHIPQEKRDRVYLRDGGQCAFVSENGARCTETKDLEVHHITPFGKDGLHEVENLQLMCRKHNLFQAKRDYGQDCVESLIVRRQANRFIHEGNSRGG